MIIDYIEGSTLRELGFRHDQYDLWNHPTGRLTNAMSRVYEQLADVFIQLRHQEFPRIGALGITKTPQPSIQVCHRPLSAEIILQTDEGHNPTILFEQGKTFQTSSEYINALLWLADNELQKSKNPWIGVRNGPSILYASHGFSKFVREKWLDPNL